MAPLSVIIFPYASLLVGLMKGLSASSYSNIVTKMTVVITLWLVTTYLVFNVSSIVRNLLSILSVWHRLTSMFDSFEDLRIPR